jgi:hypothetical protein
MITSCSQSDARHSCADGVSVRESQNESQRDQDLYGTFLEMRDLLEAYAPAWYSEALRERVEAVMQLNERFASVPRTIRNT